MLALLALSMSPSKGSDGVAYYKSLKCEPSNQFFYSNVTCYAKSFSRYISTLSAYLYFKFPLNEFFVSEQL